MKSQQIIYRIDKQLLSVNILRPNKLPVETLAYIYTLKKPYTNKDNKVDRITDIFLNQNT